MSVSARHCQLGEAPNDYLNPSTSISKSHDEDLVRARARRRSAGFFDNRFIGTTADGRQIRTTELRPGRFQDIA